jgi:hypothetical protein
MKAKKVFLEIKKIN